MKGPSVCLNFIWVLSLSFFYRLHIEFDFLEVVSRYESLGLALLASSLVPGFIFGSVQAVGSMNDRVKVVVEGCYLLHSEKLKNKIPVCWLKFVLFALNVTERLPELTGTTADVLHLGKQGRRWLV